MKKEELYMKRCLELAEKGRANTSPNPMVGSVIVHNNRIIGEGYHQKYGEAHAEVNAVNSVKDKSLLKESEIYVSLEPCAHIGKTPACSRMIIDQKIPKVIIGCRDSYKEVDGKGIEMMQKSGIQVKVGVLEKESRLLNSRFFTYHEKKRPYIILKWAQTADGYIDFERQANTPIKPNWITDEYARLMVHKWRAEEDAILVGTNTAEKDNPKLDVRSYYGKNPLRIVFDRHLRLSENLSLFDKSTPTIIFNEKKSTKNSMCEYFKINPSENVFDVMLKTLYSKGIQSLIIEGGAQLLNSVLKRNLWDEARVFIGNSTFLSGIKAPEMKVQPIKISTLKNSHLYLYENFKLEIKNK